LRTAFHRKTYVLAFAARILLNLLRVSIQLRRRPVSDVLEVLRVAACKSRPASFDLDTVVGIVQRVCAIPLFGSRWFPRRCLLQSLAFFYALRAERHEAIIHLGVRKEGSELQAHCWITTSGHASPEAEASARFARIYSFPMSSITKAGQTTVLSGLK
jgi:hypothetical protein